MTQVNLHDLANMAGYGKSQAELRMAGYWKETPLEIAYSIDEERLSYKIGEKLDRLIDALHDQEPTHD